MGKMVLVREMEYVKGVSYQEASKYLEMMNSSPAAEHIAFWISTEGGNSFGLWSVYGMSRELRKAFLARPESFVIELG